MPDPSRTSSVRVWRPSWGSRIARALLGALVAIALLLTTPTAWAYDHLIAPEQEGLVRRMVGGDELLPGGCRVERTEIARQHINVTYRCDGERQAIVWLRHPEDVGHSGAHTERFALGTQGDVPVGLVEAVTARVAARESSFTWNTVRTPPIADRRGRSVLSWLLVIVALSMLVVGIARARPPKPDVLTAAGMYVVALALRLGLGAYGPFHHNGQGPLWLTGAIGDPTFLASYGPGYSEIFRPIARLFARAPDTAIFVANAAISALAPTLAFALARVAGAERLPALVVAALLATDPISLRMAATESYLPSVIALTLAVGVLVAAAVALAERGEGVPAAMLTAAACLFGAQVVRIHPTAWVPVALAPLAAVVPPVVMPWHRRLRYAAGFGAVVGAAILVVSGAVVRGVLEALRAGGIMHPNPPGASLLVPLGVLAVVTAGLAFGPARWLALVAVPHVLVCLFTRDNFDVSPVWQQAMDRLYATVPLMSVALVLSRREAPFALVAAVIALFGGMPTLRARTTEHHEYRWLRGALRAVPQGCQVVYLGRADTTTLFLPVFPPLRNTPIADHEPESQRLRIDPSSCTYYVHGSLCSTPEGQPPCETLERRLGVTPTTAVVLPAVPGHVNQSYRFPRVRVWMARLAAR